MLKLLYIGNSFSVDALEHAVDVARNLGIDGIRIGNLYHPGCSLRMHLDHALQDAPNYTYYENDGDGWRTTPEVSILTALERDRWDVIGISPGTGDGTQHSSAEAYEPFPALVEYIRAHAAPDAKLVYNLTWVGESDRPRKELARYNGDQKLLMTLIAEQLRRHVIAPGAFRKIVPLGTAVQNARRASLMITRDGYHLSYGMGRYIAALTVIGAVTDADISETTWMPEGMTEEERDQAIRFARQALLDPFYFG